MILAGEPSSAKSATSGRESARGEFLETLTLTFLASYADLLYDETQTERDEYAPHFH